MKIKIFIVSILIAVTAHASNMQKRLDLLDKLDALDALDFQEVIEQVEACTSKRQFKCAADKLIEARKLSTNDRQNSQIQLALSELNAKRRQIEKEEEQRIQELQERRRLITEERARRKREEERKKKESGINGGQLFALAAGVVISQDMDASSRAEFLTAYSKDVIGGTTHNMAGLQRKYMQMNARQLQQEERSLQSSLSSIKKSQVSRNTYIQSTKFPKETTSRYHSIENKPKPITRSGKERCDNDYSRTWIESSQKCVTKSALYAQACGNAGGQWNGNECCKPGGVCHQPIKRIDISYRGEALFASTINSSQTPTKSWSPSTTPKSGLASNSDLNDPVKKEYLSWEENSYSACREECNGIPGDRYVSPRIAVEACKKGCGIVNWRFAATLSGNKLQCVRAKNKMPKMCKEEVPGAASYCMRAMTLWEAAKGCTNRAL